MRQLLVVPVFNEVATVRAVATDIRAHLSAPVTAVLFIDDCSDDGTSAELQAAVEGDARISVLRRAANAGYGAAMIDAFRAAHGGSFDFVITMDCDRQHRPEDIARFAGMDPTISIVSGSRYLAESGAGGVQPPADRVEINRRITTMLNRRYRLNLTDAFCGFKRYRTKDLDANSFRTKGYAFPLEFWAYAHYRALSVSELPVRRIYITDDRSFGEDLDRRRRRYQYYLRTWREADRRLRGTQP